MAKFWQKSFLTILALLLMLPVTSAVRAQIRNSAVSPLIPISTLDQRETLPDIAYNSQHDEYLVVWTYTPSGTSGEDIYAARVSPEGEILLSFTVAFGPDLQCDPVVAYDPDQDRYLVVWEYHNGSDFDLMGRFIPWYGPDLAQTAFAVNDDLMDQTNPDIVYNAHPAWPEFLVVHEDRQPTFYWAIAGVRVFSNPDGSPNTAQFTIADHDPDSRLQPAVAYNLSRNEYLVTYDVQEGPTDSGIYATRLEANGNPLDDGDADPLDGGEFEVAAGAVNEINSDAVSCVGQNQYLAAWQYTQAGHMDIYGRFVSGTGGLDSRFQISNVSGADEKLPNLACQTNGAHMMAVWEQQYSNTSGPYGVWGRIIYHDGSLGPRLAFEGAYTDAERLWPALAGGASDYLVVWSHQRYNTAIWDMYGRAFWPAVQYLPLTLH